MLLSVPRLLLPAAQGKPDQGAGNGNHQGFDDVKPPFAQQVPSQNPDKNADAFCKREFL